MIKKERVGGASAWPGMELRERKFYKTHKMACKETLPFSLSYDLLI